MQRRSLKARFRTSVLSRALFRVALLFLVCVPPFFVYLKCKNETAAKALKKNFPDVAWGYGYQLSLQAKTNWISRFLLISINRCEMSSLLLPLDWIYVSDQNFGDDDVDQILRISSISNVNVSGCAVTERGLRRLLTNGRIRELQCFEIKVERRILEAIQTEFPGQDLIYEETEEMLERR